MLQGPLYRQRGSVGFGERQTLHMREITHEKVCLKTGQHLADSSGAACDQAPALLGPGALLLQTVHAGPDAKAAKHTDSTKPEPCKLVASADDQALQAAAECLLPTSSKLGIGCTRWGQENKQDKFGQGMLPLQRPALTVPITQQHNAWRPARVLNQQQQQHQHHPLLRHLPKPNTVLVRVLDTCVHTGQKTKHCHASHNHTSHQASIPAQRLTLQTISSRGPRSHVAAP